MKIINNKIYIIRGETPTYNVSVKYRNTGVPYILTTTDSDKIKNPIVEFVVRPSIYSRDEEYVFRTYMLLEGNLSLNIHRFDSRETIEYPGTSSSYTSEWSDEVSPLVGYENYLYYKVTAGVREYRYYDANRATGKWVPYEFRISFQFPYEYTSIMENKTYKYEIVLLGGTLKSSYASDELPIDIDYKEPLLEANDFIVGGSLSE